MKIGWRKNFLRMILLIAAVIALVTVSSADNATAYFSGSVNNILWTNSAGFIWSVAGLPAHSYRIPRQAGLTGNYPSPFNPSTTIDFWLQQAENVKIAVYDIRGRFVCVLNNAR
jgi:hypothetical protein